MGEAKRVFRPSMSCEELALVVEALKFFVDFKVRIKADVDGRKLRGMNHLASNFEALLNGKRKGRRINARFIAQVKREVAYS